MRKERDELDIYLDKLTEAEREELLLDLKDNLSDVLTHKWNGSKI